MSAEWAEVEVVSLSKLKVNPQNPRYRKPYADEAEAIAALFKVIKSKLEASQKYMMNLIEDIVEYGLNPTDLPIIVPDPEEEGAYQVMEGNRRVAALKLLYFPDIASKVFQTDERNLSKKLDELRKQFKNKFNDRYIKIRCVKFSSPENALHWIELRHTGENEGRGITPWDKAARDRFRLQVQKPAHTLGTQILQILINNNYLGPDTPVVLSTIERMVKDPDVAKRIGIKIVNNQVKLPTDPQKLEFALEVLKQIASDTAEKDPQTKHKRLTSRDINKKSQRMDYLEKIISKIVPQQHDDLALVAEDVKQRTSDETKMKENSQRTVKRPSVQAGQIIPYPSKPPAKHDFKKRKFAAAPGIKVEHSRLNHLYKELCKLDADKFPNVSVIAIRVFLEGSLDEFISRFKKEKEFEALIQRYGDAYSSRVPLSTKLEYALLYLEKHDLLQPSDIQAIRKHQSNKDNPFSINTLQAYVHNPSFEPLGDSVRHLWDAYHPLFGALWKELNKVLR